MERDGLRQSDLPEIGNQAEVTGSLNLNFAALEGLREGFSLLRAG